MNVAESLADVSPRDRNDGRSCGWCRRSLEDARQRYCGRKCRQTAFRLRRRRATDAANTVPGVFAYADPPYPGLARKYYGKEDSFGGEVDHVALIASLEASGYAGWALSTSERALRTLLPLCPEGARVLPWVKPIGVSGLTYGLHNVWEPLIVVGGRALRPGKRDFLIAQPARFGGELMGRKPLAFCAFLFESLGMLPGDQLVDLFPGTGAVSRAWVSLTDRGSSSEYSRDASSTPTADASPGDGEDTSLAPARTTPRARKSSPPPGGDASSRAAQNGALS